MNTAVGCIGLLRSNAPGSIIIAGESAMMTTSMVSTGGNPNNPIADFESGPSFLCHRPDHMVSPTMIICFFNSDPRAISMFFIRWRAFHDWSVICFDTKCIPRQQLVPTTAEWIDSATSSLECTTNIIAVGHLKAKTMLDYTG